MRVKRRIFAGVVCEQIIYNVPDRCENLRESRPRVRFHSAEEREAHNAEVSRRAFTRLVNGFSPTALYSTETLDDEHEVHDFASARRLRDNWVRKLKYHYPEAKLILVMGRGKSTSRIHYHMISEGIPEDALRRLWTAGKIVHVTPMREHNYYDGVDHGRDYSALAAYLHAHWTPEQGTRRRWKATANVTRPEVETPKVVKRAYSEQRPPRPPKGYVLVESTLNRWGYLYFKYVRTPAHPRI